MTAFKNSTQQADTEALWDFLKVQMLDEVQLKKKEKEKVMLMLKQLLEQKR